MLGDRALFVSRQKLKTTNGRYNNFHLIAPQEEKLLSRRLLNYLLCCDRRIRSWKFRL